MPLSADNIGRLAYLSGAEGSEGGGDGSRRGRGGCRAKTRMEADYSLWSLLRTNAERRKEFCVLDGRRVQVLHRGTEPTTFKSTSHIL